MFLHKHELKVISFVLFSLITAKFIPRFLNTIFVHPMGSLGNQDSSASRCIGRKNNKILVHHI